VPNPQSTKRNLKNVLQMLDLRDADDPAEVLDEVLSPLTETAERLREQMVQLVSDRDQLVAERDLALHKEAMMRQALKVLVDEWDALNDTKAGNIDASEFDPHVQTARELIEAV
jgi:DNA-binding transcriptional MerR regulator